MEALWVPYAELLDACLAGRVQDAPVLVAVLTARQRGLVGTPPEGRRGPPRLWWNPAGTATRGATGRAHGDGG